MFLFVCRDGKMFGHILNFMRTGRPLLPEGFDQFELLLEEARYYELTGTDKTMSQKGKKYIFYHHFVL